MMFTDNTPETYSTYAEYCQQIKMKYLTVDEARFFTEGFTMNPDEESKSDEIEICFD